MRREELKSQEEWEFHLWLLDAMKYRFISEWAYEPTEFVISEQVFCVEEVQMKTKRKHVDFKLFTNDDILTYTPDFRFRLTEKGMDLLSHQLRGCVFCEKDWKNYVCYVDVKGGYNPYGGDHRAFFLKQRMMYALNKIYVQKIVPETFFKRTFAPECLRWMKCRKEPTLTKLGRKTKSSKEFQDENAWRLIDAR